MNREVLFRGKRVDNGEWIEGFFAKSGDKTFILIDNDIAVGYVAMKEVIAETSGQYTGLTDKNGTKIFEGDIIECDWFNAMVKIEHRKHLIIFDRASFCGEWRIGNNKYNNFLHDTFNRKIIGNIYDNPELMEETE